MNKKKWNVVPGFFSDNEAAELQRLCQDKICLEIGSFYGKSTVCIAEVAKSVLAVDTWQSAGDGQTQTGRLSEGIFDTFLNATWGYDNIKYIMGFSHDVVPALEGKQFDVVFIDATHSYEGVKKDVEISLPKLKDDGVFIFHDYTTWRGVAEAVDELFKGLDGVVDSLASSRKENLR